MDIQIKEFLATLKRSHFSLAVDKGSLILKGDKSKLSDTEIKAIRQNHEVITYIKTHKAELIEYLSSFENAIPEKDSGNVASIYHLSSLQQGMLFHGLYDEEGGSYIEQLACDVIDPDIEIFEKSWNQVLKNHSILRSAFFYDAFSVPVQCVYHNVKLPLEILDYRGLSKQQQSEAISAYEAADIAKGFDFKVAPLMRITLTRLDEQHYRMLWTSHHILFDGWSLPLIIEELLTVYESLKEGREISAEEDKYEDYIRYLKRRDKDQEQSYWSNYLNGLDQGTLLPYIQTTAERTKGVGEYGYELLEIDASYTEKVQNYAQANSITVNTLMQGIWAWLLHYYTNRNNVVYGVIVSGRPDDFSNMERRVGMYINTLPLHARLAGDIKIKTFLQQLQVEQVSSRQYQHVPLEEVKISTGIQGDLFDSLLVFENYPINKLISSKQWSLQLKNFDILYEQNNYPLTIIIVNNKELTIRFSYNIQLLDAEYVKEIKEHFKQVLLETIDNPEAKIGDISLSENVAQKVSEYSLGKNHTAAEGQSITALFEQSVGADPNNTALIYGQEKLTYRELNERSNQLARYLRAQGVSTGMLVPVCQERGPGMVTAILGILKAGGAYVPVDPAYPQDRISYMLEDTGAELVLGSSATRDKLSGTAARVLELDKLKEALSSYGTTNLSGEPQSGDLAYVIYTSGSTGRPKGVMIEHGSLSNYLQNSGTKYMSDDPDTTGSFIYLSYTFDASLTALFMPLINGKAAVISTRHSTEVFEDANLKKYAPYDFIKITPAHLEMIQPVLKLSNGTLLTKKLVIGGEALLAGHFNYFKEAGVNVEVINEYGPTETTVGCSTYSYYTQGDDQNAKHNIPIGKPIDNTQIYILGSNGQSCPVGIPGELCIGGAQVARGYLNQPELTGIKFIANTFSGRTGARLYKTGDLARWLPDGNLEYLGRMDDQVKIRGYRVELGEVENELGRYEGVRQSVVLAKDAQGGGKTLISYYVPQWEALKAQEASHYKRQVATWKEIYETEYGQTEGAENIDEEFNLIGWNDSFTGGAIPEVQMAEWLDDIVGLILSEKAGHVLEIGCGTGLIFYQLAGKVKKYTGTDLSRSSISQITHRLSKGLRDYGPTAFWVSPAHEVSLPEGEKADTILLNSIVQYFPGEGYMDTVISQSLSLLNEGGRIIIGDVRDNRLLELFELRLQMQKLPSAASVQELDWITGQEVLKEEELCFSPGYFYNLAAKYPQITQVVIEWKQGSSINELTLYRYNVVLYVGAAKPVIEPKWVKWHGQDKQSLFELLDSRQDMIALESVPNPRLWKERLLQSALQQKRSGKLGDLTEVITREDTETVLVREVLGKAEAAGYRCRMLLNDDALLVNLVLEKTSRQNIVANNIKSYNHAPATNIPLFTDISLTIRQQIRSYLKERLPDYMIPQDFIAVNHLPLTNNGKIDRRFLNSRDDHSLRSSYDYALPTTALEQKLAGIWQELLGVERVGINDNFFDLGGHSLSAMRMVSAIRRQLQTELSIKDVFVYSNIALLAVHLGKITGGLLLPEIVQVTPRPEHIPLSFSQERLWFIDQLEGSVQYHIPAVLRLRGKLDKAALERALGAVVDRQEALRTVIQEDGQGGTWQRQLPAGSWSLGYREATGQARTATESYIQEQVSRPFDLRLDHMLRAELLKVGEQEHMLILTLHHIASDGWSTPILVREVAALYAQQTGGGSARLPALAVQYADYALWQRGYLQGAVLEEKLSYWEEQLRGVQPLELPLDHARPAVQGTAGALHPLRISREQTRKLQQLSREQGVTLYMTLLAAFKVLLYRYSGQEDITVGTAVAGRSRQETEGLIGFFINTLALRSRVAGEQPFTAVLEAVRKTTLEAYGHQDVPFEKVVERVVRERDRSRSPLFQVMFVLQNTPEVPELKLGEVELSAEEAAGATAKFDLSVSLTESNEGLTGTIEYSTSLYEAETIARMADHLEALLESVVASPGEQAGRLKMLNAAEYRQLEAFSGAEERDKTEEGQGTIERKRQESRDKNQESRIKIQESRDKRQECQRITALFEQSVGADPNNTALIYGQEKLTYRELNERSNQLARYLRAQGVSTGMLVPVCQERGPGMVTAILGILKAGGAYVPVDPAYPQDRISYMLEDTGAELVLGSSATRDKLQGTKARVLELDKLKEALSSYGTTNLSGEPQSGDLAYVIYTSGSTGRPKGVMIEHGSLINLATWHNRAYEVSGSCMATSMAGVSFDAFGWEIWPYLSTGAGICILSDEQRLRAEELPALFERHGVTHSFVATALFPELYKALGNHAGSLKYLLTGGDRLNTTVITGENSYEIVNNYGPTENTVVTSSYRLSAEDSSRTPPIGRPIDHTQVYILDKAGELSPVGVPGELCIGGAGLARGYLNRPELTAEKFISWTKDGKTRDKRQESGDKNQESRDKRQATRDQEPETRNQEPETRNQEPDSETAIRLYKTGDLARWLPDGNLEYLGRIDDQVKVRGYRIELGEIESVLDAHGSIRQSVVMAREDQGGNKRLVGYVVSEGTFDKQEIQGYLQSRLPEYMVPQQWVELEALPLTPNGKTDRRSLPEPGEGTGTAERSYEAPRNRTEEQLAEIWQELLHVERVGIHDNFFELGGHSLLAMRLVSAIEKQLLVSIPINMLFQFTTIAGISKYLEIQDSTGNEKSVSFDLLDV